MTSGPRLLGPRLLKTGPRLLDTAGPRLLGPRLLKTGPRLLEPQTRQLHMTGPRLLKTGPRLLESAGPRLLGPRLLKTGPRLLGPRLLKTQSRQLHMTGPATFPSQFLTSEKSLATAIEKQQSKSESASITSTRSFNTSRSLKAVGDNSTIDFAFLPDARILAYGPSQPEDLRVPILPLAFFPPRGNYDNNSGELDIPVHRPIVSTAAADSTHISSPSMLTDLSEDAVHADFHDVEEQLAGVVKGAAEKAGMQAKETEEVIAKAQGLMKQVWKGFMEDVFGNKSTNKA